MYVSLQSFITLEALKTSEGQDKSTTHQHISANHLILQKGCEHSFIINDPALPINADFEFQVFLLEMFLICDKKNARIKYLGNYNEYQLILITLWIKLISILCYFYSVFSYDSRMYFSKIL